MNRYVVVGESGAYSYAAFWLACTFEDSEQAKAHADRLNEAYAALACKANLKYIGSTEYFLGKIEGDDAKDAYYALAALDPVGAERGGYGFLDDETHYHVVEVPDGHRLPGEEQ